MNYRNFVDRQISFYGDFEIDQIDFLFAAIREHGCDLFLDIGANIGVYTVIAGRLATIDRVIAFEPDPRNVRQLGANLLINSMVGSVEIVEKAVSNRTGPVPFDFFPDDSTGQSRIEAGGAESTVDAVRLDDLIEQNGATIFVKIDVEGHEPQVLEGMAKLLGSNRIFLQVESFPEQIEHVSLFLEALGFRHIRQIDSDHYFTNF